MARYEIELWNKNNEPVADIRRYCYGLSWSKTLNGADALTFSIDLNRFESLLSTLGFTNDPFGFFEVGRFDVRIKRNGQYILGANAYRFNYSTNDPSITMTVECVGYLNFYKTQYVTATFQDVPQHEILWQVINQCNQKPGGDYGIRQGTHTGAIVRRVRHYTRKEVASLIQQMSSVINGCDFSFTPDKKFNTYEAKGVYRPSVVLHYGEGGNIQNFSFSRSIEKTANYIYGLGSGNGDDVVSHESEDTASENYLYRRERIITWNSVTRDDTITEHTESALHSLKDIVELPAITLRNDTLDLSVVDVGDTVVVDLGDNLLLKHIKGDYRITDIVCNVDENDSEVVKLSFDSLDIDEIIQSQDSEDDDV